MIGFLTRRKQAERTAAQQQEQAARAEVSRLAKLAADAGDLSDTDGERLIAAAALIGLPLDEVEDGDSFAKLVSDFRAIKDGEAVRQTLPALTKAADAASKQYTEDWAKADAYARDTERMIKERQAEFERMRSEASTRNRDASEALKAAKKAEFKARELTYERWQELGLKVQPNKPIPEPIY